MSAADQLDWWVRERREWFGRVHGPDGRQRWIKAAAPAKISLLTASTMSVFRTMNFWWSLCVSELVRLIEPSIRFRLCNLA